MYPKGPVIKNIIFKASPVSRDFHAVKLPNYPNSKMSASQIESLGYALLGRSMDEHIDVWKLAVAKLSPFIVNVSGLLSILRLKNAPPIVYVSDVTVGFYMIQKSI